ncbi:Oidioi.mRNA.OKI2018_I69.chr1.g764.t1.cds [Oikopleura dioica]|uniref:Oidioi.mRNA.OKI2018_I69.chr1.g764.t1.cds n=1 Tax=Oikopleura dioica TaxID=34765 RepID=A0ABN7SS65_OIKDI|nr:Oidioi.mRNA.OKI2018_I69.chr1.g764.t1.cds [Oikopleura dioica]
MMIKLIVINILFSKLEVAEAGVACPNSWSTFGDFHYKVFESGKDGVGEKSWNEAESYCNSQGGDLVDFQSEQEMLFIYNQLNWQERGYRGYWIGLNNLENVNQNVWVNSMSIEKPYNFKYWGPQQETNSDPSKRCTFALFTENLPQDYGTEGKWVKNECTKRFSFICKVQKMGCVPDCRNEEGWYKMDVGRSDPSCVKVIPSSTNRNFDLTNSKCQDMGGQLVTIENMEENDFIVDLIQDEIKKWDQAVQNKYYGAWIGLNNLNAPKNQPDRFEWVSGAPDFGFRNWAYGEPDAALDMYPSAIAAAFGNPGSGEWEAVISREQLSGVCQKPLGGTCPDGWSLIRINDNSSKCYKFFLNGQYHQPWLEAKKYCESVGAEQLRIQSIQEQEALGNYFHEWLDAGVTRMWLDLSNMHQSVPLNGAQCDMRYSSSGQSPGYTSWEAEQPKCLEQSHSCAYMNLEKSKQNWISEGCTSREAFACSMPAPFNLRPTEKPTSNLTCYNDASWTLNFYLNEDNGMCYSFSNFYNGTSLLKGL